MRAAWRAEASGMLSFRSSPLMRRAATENVLDSRLDGVHNLVESQLALIEVLAANAGGLRRERIATIRDQLRGIDVRIGAARHALRGGDAGGAGDGLCSAIDDANAATRLLAGGNRTS